MRKTNPDEDLRDLERRARAGDRDALAELEDRAEAVLGPRADPGFHDVKAPGGVVFRVSADRVTYMDDPDGPGIVFEAPDGGGDLKRVSVSYAMRAGEWDKPRLLAGGKIEYARPGEFEADPRRRGWPDETFSSPPNGSWSVAAQQWIRRWITPFVEQWVAANRAEFGREMASVRALIASHAVQDARSRLAEVEEDLLDALDAELAAGGSPVSARQGPVAVPSPVVVSSTAGRSDVSWNALFEAVAVDGAERVRFSGASRRGRDLAQLLEPSNLAWGNPVFDAVLDALGPLENVNIDEVEVEFASPSPAGAAGDIYLLPRRFSTVGQVAEALRGRFGAGRFEVDQPYGIIDAWVKFVPDDQGDDLIQAALERFRRSGLEPSIWQLGGGIEGVGLGPVQLGTPGLSLWVAEDVSGDADAALAVSWDAPATETLARRFLDQGTGGDRLEDGGDDTLVFVGALERVLEYAARTALAARADE